MIQKCSLHDIEAKVTQLIENEAFNHMSAQWNGDGWQQQMCKDMAKRVMAFLHEPLQVISDEGILELDTYGEDPALFVADMDLK